MALKAIHKSKNEQSIVKALDENKVNKHWYYCLLIVIFLAVSTRFYKIHEPDHVCWDETHFGKMGSWYINHTFFFDVHPPLGKMLIGFSGKLTGYNGTFPFNKPGDKYGDHNYLGMRLFCVTLGTLIIPFCYIIVWEFTRSVKAALFASFFIIFDVGMITLSQYILLDPLLMFFIIGSVLGMAKFRSAHESPFSLSWWFWLSWTGVFMACAISVKFVGLFVILLVGTYTACDLWLMLGDLSIPLLKIAKHFAARVICLIILPTLLYMFFFFIHFSVLYKSGSGDGFFSSAFQSQLEGNSLYNSSMPREVAYGAVLTIKNHRTGGGYLHSHWHLYPEGVGARQQQVTAYTHKDDNNKWIIKRFDVDPDPSQPVQLVRSGDLIRLEHIMTTRNLHSHREPAPITRRHFQVTCYGENGTGDANDVWRIEIIGGRQHDVVTTVTSQLRFIHYLSNCALHSHSKQLPKWGFEQMEVTCTPNLRDKNTIWNVEDNYFPKLPNVSIEAYAPNFLEKFLESHAVMLQGNAGLKPKEGEVTSRPWQWPLNYRGQFFSGQQYKIYLLGNPIIWWGNLVILVLYAFIQLGTALYLRRGYHLPPLVKERTTVMGKACGWLFLGWALHYLPFYAMGRVLYFHHYFPALLFSSMLSGVLVDYICDMLVWIAVTMKYETVAKTLFHTTCGLVSGALIYSFYLFQPLSYGMDGDSSSANSNSTMHGLRWLESWEF